MINVSGDTESYDTWAQIMERSHRERHSGRQVVGIHALLPSVSSSFPYSPL